MDNTNALISIIVPIYKVEQYLHRCVDSLLGRTYGDFELILVDDGSPDGCGSICDAYADTDCRVRVIHKPNGGLSDARNAGMDIAVGHEDDFKAMGLPESVRNRKTVPKREVVSEPSF